MRVIIAGTRAVSDVGLVARAVVDSGFEVTEVVSGGARGVDRLGEEWARSQGIPVRRFPADWDRYGRRAGPVRNQEMADYAEALIAIWDGNSAGTRDMIGRARAKGIPVFIYKYLESDEAVHA